MLLFQFEIKVDLLKLNIYIGPGPERIRAKLFELARSHSHIFKTQSKSLNQKWNSIFSRKYLHPKDYEEASDEFLTDKINKTWNEFVTGELSSIITALTSQETLEELVAGITDDNRHDETDWGEPVGKEFS